MKRRLSAIVLALGLSLSAYSMGVYAEEAATEATEQVTETVTEATTEAETDTASETAETAAETEAMTPEEQYMQILSTYAAQVSGWTDELIEAYIDGDDLTGAAIAANWKSVKEELGAFVEITDAQLSADGTSISGHAKYEKIDEGTDVIVTYSINEETQSATMTWDIDYPMIVNLQRAGLNTVMGIAIVFIVLLFLSWLISQMHIIPDIVEKMSKKNAPAETPKAAPAPVAAAPVVEEEDYVDDLELVAVITAAIAASENTSSDGFVVRSIKKANKRNWQRA